MALPITPTTDVSIIRLTEAMFNLRPGYTYLTQFRDSVETSNIDAFSNDLVTLASSYFQDHKFTNTELAAKVVANLELTGAAATEATNYLLARFNALPATGPEQRGQVILDAMNLLSTMESDPAFGIFAKKFNSDVASSLSYSSAAGNVAVIESTTNSPIIFNLVAEKAAGADVMHLSGTQEVRIDLTNPANQIKGLDINGDGTIQNNGIENVQTGKAANFEIVDAYARNPLNQTDATKNFLGDINFDGTGYAGDGVNTDGNIYLGGLGADTAFGGIGNDFLAGGGVATDRFVTETNSLGGTFVRDTLTSQVGAAGADQLHGGRNADFMFAELSALDPTDGNGTVFDGGNTTDDSAAGLAQSASGVNSQNNDWILLEASDDNEPVAVTLGAFGGIAARSNAAVASLTDIESVDASGNLYGFLNDVNVQLGGRATDARSTAPVAGTENYGIGSTAQLAITGSAAANVIIGGYDNDAISGDAGNDILAGGNLKFLETNKSNPNLLNATGGLDLNVTVGVVTDGRDTLNGDAGNDIIVFEMDSGTVAGGVDTGTTSGADRKATGDTLYVTDFSTGRVLGATTAGEATAQQDALAKITVDKTVRFDLGNDGVAAFKNYGGSNAASQDATKYATGKTLVGVTGIESVIATGLGGIDYKAAGTNSPELTFNNQQNYGAINANLDLRGDGKDNTLYANTGNDTVEGRGGDDNLSGGTGDDKFVFSFGDGVDNVHRQKDTVNNVTNAAGADGLWDVGATGAGLFVQDFRAPQTGDIASSRLTVDFGTTDLSSTNVSVLVFNLKIGGVAFSVSDTAGMQAAKSASALATVINKAYQAIDAKVTVAAVGNTLVVSDTAGRDISDTIAEGYGVGVVLGNGFASTTPTFVPGGTPINLVENDVITIQTYDNRSINLGANETITEINNAVNLVTRLDASGSQLAEQQKMLIKLTDVNEGDKVTVTINGKGYSYTALAGENSEAVSAKLVAVINNELDLNSASGQVIAVNNAEVAEFDEADTTGGIQDVSGNSAVLSVAQAVVGGSQTYMNTSVTITNALTSTAAGSATLHNQSNTHIDLVGFDGRNGNLNGADVLFLGRSATSVSLLQTAKNAGETLTGKEATLDADTANTWINGDDLLIGGDKDDTINAGTGDDRILVSKGTDVVNGGGNTINADSTVFAYTDVLQAEEGTFATGTRFKVTLDGTLGEAGKGKGVLLAQDAASVTIGTTTFNGIETVRVLENSRASGLDVKALSDSIATAVGTNVITGTEGLTVNLTRTTPSVTYSVDTNNNGNVLDAGDYNAFVATQVYGVEHVTTGNANDTVNIDASQIGTNNTITLGGQQDNTVTFAEGEDVVSYTHTVAAGTALADAASVPVMTVKVESAADTDEVSLTGGILGSSVTKDTLVGTERVSVAAAANSGVADTLDVSALAAGATIGFGTAQTVNKSQGGANLATSVAFIEANTLEAGGVSTSGTGFGNEKLEITVITQLEIITGSVGDDRVIVGDAVVNAQEVLAPAALGRVSVAGSATGLNVTNAGLYTFNLGAGNNDTVDYFNAADDIAVSVDTSGNGAHYVLVDETVGGGVVVNDQAQDRVDFVTGVERFFGTDTGLNVIDLSAATVATTVQFSKESLAAGNEFAELNGNNGITTTDLVRGIEVRDTSASTVFGRFMDRTGANATGNAYWTQVQGSAQAETVVLTDNESGAVAHTLNLFAGANVVDYSARTASVTLAVGGAVAGASVTQSATVDGDTINVTAASYASGVKTLTVKGSSQNSDVVSVAALNVDTDSYNLVDLAAGVAVEDVLSADVPANIQGTAIYFSGFENIAGSASIDRLYGNGSINSINGAAGNDWIVGRGGFTSLPATTVGGGDILTGGLGNDRFIYETQADSATDVTVNDSQDNITDFAAGDLLVFNTTDAGAVLSGAAASVFTDGGAAANSRMQIDQNGSGGVFTAADSDYSIYDTTGNASATSVLMRVAQSAGQDIQFLNKSVNAVDGQFEVVYTAASQSNNLALPDEFHGINLDHDGVAVVGADKFDFRSFDFGLIRTAADDANSDNIADSIQSILYSEPATVNSITSVANFFRVGALSTGVERAVNIQRESGTTNFRVFVDANRDGDYTQADDLVFDIRDPLNNSGVAMVVADATTAATFYNDANADGVADVAGVSANIFVFNDVQYNLWDSVAPAPGVPTYALTHAPATVNEGAAVNFSLATTNVADGVVLPYTLSGVGITAADVVGGLAGFLTVTAGAAIVPISLVADGATEGPETLVLTLGAALATDSVLVNDTSVAGGGTVLAIGSSAAVAATAGNDLFTFDVAAAKASVPNTQIPITGFATAFDKLQIDTTTALGNTTLNLLNGVDGISVQTNAILNNTLINFGPDGNGDVVTITLAGVVDPTLVQINVI